MINTILKRYPKAEDKYALPKVYVPPLGISVVNKSGQITFVATDSALVRIKDEIRRIEYFIINCFMLISCFHCLVFNVCIFDNVRYSIYIKHFSNHS